MLNLENIWNLNHNNNKELLSLIYNYIPIEFSKSEEEEKP